MIHSTAIVAPSVVVSEDCEIGPYSMIEDGVTIGSGCRIASHVVLRAGTVLDEGVSIDAGAVIGGEPQDVGFDGSIRSGVRVGARTVIRETVTVSRSSREGGQTVIGEHCYLMAACHVAHDCILGDRVVLANAALLAGHVHVGRHSFIGGSAGIHQFCRVGESVMLGGNASISLDLPPFTIVADRNRLAGLNLIGLRRRGFAREVISDLKACFGAVYRGGSNPREAAARAVDQNLAKTEEGALFLAFFAGGKRGVVRPGREER